MLSTSPTFACLHLPLKVRKWSKAEHWKCYLDGNTVMDAISNTVYLDLLTTCVKTNCLSVLHAQWLLCTHTPKYGTRCTIALRMLMVVPNPFVVWKGNDKMEDPSIYFCSLATSRASTWKISAVASEVCCSGVTSVIHCLFVRRGIGILVVVKWVSSLCFEGMSLRRFFVVTCKCCRLRYLWSLFEMSLIHVVTSIHEDSFEDGKSVIVSEGGINAPEK